MVSLVGKKAVVPKKIFHHSAAAFLIVNSASVVKKLENEEKNAFNNINLTLAPYNTSTQRLLPQLTKR